MPLRQAPWVAPACALAMGCGGWPRPAPDGGQPDGGSSPRTLTDFKTDGSIGARFDLTTQTLAYGRANQGGAYKVFLSDADGSNERALTFAAWPADRHQFPVEWAAAGQYLLVEVEKTTHPGSSSDAIPGYGAYTDLWAVTRDGSQAWPTCSTSLRWLVDLDGSNRRRLTFMNKTGDPQSNGHRLLAGSISFDTDHSFYGDVLTAVFGLTGKIVKVSCPAL